MFHKKKIQENLPPLFFCLSYKRKNVRKRLNIFRASIFVKSLKYLFLFTQFDNFYLMVLKVPFITTPFFKAVRLIIIKKKIKNKKNLPPAHFFSNLDENLNIYFVWPNSVCWKIIFYISHPKHMLWILNEMGF